VAAKHVSIILQHVRKILTVKELEQLSDRELLRRFAREREEAAFATLVRRHGPMVLHGCQRVLHNWHDAEDAFQATFLVLARKAAARRWDESVGTWLYLVAYRLALNIRAGRDRNLPPNPHPMERSCQDPFAVASQNELSDLLDEELSRLPEKCRAALVLCALEGFTRDEAARQLGWSFGTFRRRLEQGRALLRERLIRRGLPLSALFATVLGTKDSVKAALPFELTQAVVQAAVRSTLEKGVPAALVSSRVAALTQGALKGLVLSKVKAALMIFLAVGIAGVGTGLAVQRLAATKPAEQRQEEQPRSVVLAASRPSTEQPRVALDRYGDPLPQEAISRLGTVRLRHGGFTGVVRFTPDGKTVVSQGGDGVRSWDVATGKQIHFLSRETMGRSFRGEVSFSADRRQVLAANEAGIHLWDLATAGRLRTVATGDYHLVRWSPNCELIAAVPAKDSNQVELWESKKAQRLWSWSRVTQPLADVAFTANGKTVIAAGWGIHQHPPLTDNTIRFLDIETGKELREIKLGTRKPESVAPSPDSTLLAVIYYDEKGSERQVGVFDLASGKERFRLLQPGPGTYGQRFFSAITFAPDGKSLLTAGGEGSLIVWDLATGKELQRLGRDMTNSHDITFSPDGKAVGVANCCRIRVIERAGGEDLLSPSGHPNVVHSTATTPDGRTVITASAGSVLIWDPLTGQERQRWETEPHAPYILTDDGRTAFVMQLEEKTIRVWDLATGRERSRMKVDFLGKLPGVKAIAPGGKLLALGTFTGDTVYLMNTTNGKLLRSFQDPGRMVAQADVAADARTLVTYRDDHTAQMWDIATGARLRQLGPMGDPGAECQRTTDGWGISYSARLSPDGQWLAYGRREYVSLYHTATGRETHRLTGFSSGAGALTFSPDSRVLAWVDESNIHLLEIASGKERHALIGHRGSVLSLYFSLDGKTLVSGSSDSTALVWDLTGRFADERTWGKALSRVALDAGWAALADEDAARAYRVIRRLASTPDQAISYLRGQLHPVEPVNEKHLENLIADLDSPEFSVREKAAKALESFGERAAAACRRGLADHPCLETRRRLEAVLEKQSQRWKSPTRETLQALRALEVLELANTQQARQTLQRLASGTPEARLTQEAKASLERLAKRSAVFP
jgi:RNA polymerase sigma factor (sigma-70 family)